MTTSLSHVALLVPSVEKSASFLCSLGIKCEPPEVFQGEGTKEVYVGSYENQSGLLLLLEAISDGPYQRAMEKRGPSLHHIAIDVANLDEFLIGVKSHGWKLHPVTPNTLKQSNTAWLYLEGVPTLIEVHQGARSLKQSKVSKIEISLPKNYEALFGVLGLGDFIVDSGDGFHLTVDGLRMSFSQLAGVN